LNLSVIIPTRNRANYLKNAFESIKNQSLPSNEYEVIVVDNGSTDNTKQIVEEFNSNVQNIRYFFDATPGLHIGRHIGLKESQSDILVYADDDIEAFPTWLEGIWESFQDNNVALVGGKNLPKW
jgi:glycosyltransferase involved in cell wall biosynthesis